SPKKTPYDFVPVGRSQWFTITRDQVNYIYDYSREHRKLIQFFKLTWGSDELFFQTILYNSVYKKDMVNNNLRLIDWSEKKSSPKTFTLKDA
ncbi:beta-1,6-N-acetylglucosaminyltransferase, partial [Acinetobacter baumannii]